MGVGGSWGNKSEMLKACQTFYYKAQKLKLNKKPLMVSQSNSKWKGTNMTKETRLCLALLDLSSLCREIHDCMGMETGMAPSHSRNPLLQSSGSLMRQCGKAHLDNNVYVQVNSGLLSRRWDVSMAGMSVWLLSRALKSI